MSNDHSQRGTRYLAMKDQGPTGPRKPHGTDKQKEIEMTQFHQLSTHSDEMSEDTQIDMSFKSIGEDRE